MMPRGRHNTCAHRKFIEHMKKKKKQVLTSMVAGGQGTDSVSVQIPAAAKKQQALKNSH